MENEVKTKQETIAEVQMPTVSFQQFNEVENVLNNWLQQALCVESNLQKSQNLKNVIDESLEKMRMDGLLTYIKYEELKSMGNLWYELDEQIICYCMGTESNKRRIIEILLEMYTLKQVSCDLFLNIIMQL